MTDHRPAQELLAPMRRETDINTIHGKIEDVRRARFDVVAPQSSFRLVESAEGVETRLAVGPDGLLTEDGVLAPNSLMASGFTQTAWRQIHERLNIPLQYANRLHADQQYAVRRLGLENVNVLAEHDGRNAMYRYLRTADGLILRSVLSDRYQALDNDTAFLAILAGLGAHDLSLNDCEIDGDVTPDRLRLRVAVPAINLAIPELLAGYRMPFTMDQQRDVHAPPAEGEVPPVVWAGIEISNSETGGGAFAISPRAVIMICRNGLTRPVEFRRAHVGSALNDGVVQWSSETVRRALSLISSQVEDAVRQFMSVEYLQTIATEMQTANAVAIDQPSRAVEVVQQRCGFTEDETQRILDCFIRGGQPTALGVAQAVTAAAQLADDGDRQSEMETAFWRVIGDARLLSNA